MTIKRHDRGKHKWRPFIAARAWAHEQRFASGTGWRGFCALGKMPSDIPRSPDYAYRDQWVSWGDFLGTGYVASQKRGYRSFEESREWARAQGLKSNTEWLKLAREGRLPEDIPINARQFYHSEWQGIGDFLGNGYVAPHNRQYRSFAMAREWARAKGLQSESQWREYSKQADWLPRDIPANVYTFYKREWTSWGDFLGTGYVSTQKRHYRPYAEACEWARVQALKSSSDWNKRIKEPSWLPSDIPADPRATYGKEFTTFGDFLGTGNIAPSKRQFRPFHEARAWAREQKLDDVEAWKELVKSSKAAKLWPRDIPTNPNVTYTSEWKGWEDFLGVPRMHRHSKVEERLRHELANLLPINLDFRRIQIPGVRALEIDMCAPRIHLVIEFDGNHWHKEAEARDRAKTEMLEAAGWTVVRIREHPLDLIGPKDVRVPAKQSTYRRTLTVLKHLLTLGYVSLEIVEKYETGGRVLSCSTASNAIRTTWRSFADARAWVRAQGITSQSQWTKLLKQEGWLPSDIPRYPLEVYADECATWGEFLGTGRLATFKREYRTFEQAREWARAKQLKSRTEWNALAKQPGWLPPDIPSNVYQTYKRDWTSWGDFLGTGNRAPSDHQWRSFTSAREWARKQKLSSREGWAALRRNMVLPTDIPASPQTVYASEWMCWRDFLGN